MQLPHALTGARTAQLLADHAALVQRSGGVLLLRHSAREFEPGRHDLLNPLTDAGRELASKLGAQLPAGLSLYGYASPVERCVETAELMLAAYTGGEAGRTRKMEGLGAFYVLDQMKMFRALQAAGGLRAFVSAWSAEALSADMVMPARAAVQALLTGLAARLPNYQPQASDRARLDVCVSHDLTLQVTRSVVYGVDAEQDADVEFLDALLLIGGADGPLVAAHDYPLQPLQVD